MSSFVSRMVVPYTPGDMADDFDVHNLDGTIRRLRGRLAREERPMPEHEPNPYGHEVEITVGRCVTWGCERTVFGWGDGRRECSEHALEPFPVDDRDRGAERERQRQRMAADPAYAERVRAKRAAAARRQRANNPAFRERHRLAMREKRRVAREQKQLATAGAS